MKIKPDLTGVPETMLWTLYNRAIEAKKPCGLIQDSEAARLYDALDYDFARHFGLADGSHAVRAAEFDVIVRTWLQQHPDGWVVALGEGLETQFSRVDNGRLNWLTVDLPEAMQLRDQLLPLRPREHRYTGSALDHAWMERLPASIHGEDVCIIAQGLFMYLPPEETRRLLADIAARLPGCLLAFDSIPHWLSRLTLRPGGFRRTRHYTIPPMPWGIDCDEVAATLRRWGVSSESETRPYRLPRGVPRLTALLFSLFPKLRPQVPAITAAVLRPVLPAA
ncbi:MAG TPA: class I SAM-dependent methyltransferase [Candidatus Nitrosotalea sp.]|nr:class I SAM-dependent methyltransferase [Candidatus Nitrosotalea sp.]